MKQKIILDSNILYKNGREIELTPMQVKLLKILKDELLHSYSSLIKKARIKRGIFEKALLENNIYKLKKRTGLQIEHLKAHGYFLNEKIYINH